MPFTPDRQKAVFTPDEQPSLIDKVPDWAVPGYTKAIVHGYNRIKNSISDAVGNNFPNDVSYPHSIPNIFMPTMPIPIGNRTPREDAKVLTDMGVDTVATMGVTEGLPALFKGAKVLPELASSATEDIPKVFKNVGRSLEQIKNPPVPFEQRLSGVKNQVKNALSNSINEAHKNIGENLVPKAKDIITSNIESMHPETLKQIGIKPEILNDIKIAKEQYALKKLPTKAEADDLFEKVTNQDAFNGRIETTEFNQNVGKAIDELKPGLGKEHTLVRPLESIQSDLQKNPFLTKKQYLATRRNLGELFTGNPDTDRVIYAVRDSLDNDAAHSGITGISKAKTIYRISREAEKVDTYLNNPKLGEQLQSQVKKSSNPTDIQARESMKNLLGKNPEEVLPGLDKEQLAKQEAERRGSALAKRESERNQLVAKKKGRQAIAKVGAAGTALVGVPEIGRRIFHLLNSGK